MESVKGEAMPLGSRLLKILTDLAQLQSGGLNRLQALDEMHTRRGWYDPALLDAVREYYGVGAVARDAAGPGISISICDLSPGMVLHSNVETKAGAVILHAGHYLTEMTLEKIKNFNRVSGVKEPLFVESPESALP